MSTETVEKKVLPADYGKMPAGYNFLTRGRNELRFGMQNYGNKCRKFSYGAMAIFQSLIMNNSKYVLELVCDWNSKFLNRQELEGV